MSALAQPLISLVMIVKDEAAILRETLELVRPFVDEFVVVDTGSSDETPAIVADFGPVHTLPFVDFIATKNRALELATGRYILLLDADERLVSGGPQLREWAEEGRIDCVDGWILDGPSADRPTLRYSRARLWRNDGRWQFHGPGCHEYIACDGPETTCLDHRITFFHDHGHRSPASYAARNRQYLALLQAALDDDPADSRAWFYLARTLMDDNQPLAAISAYEQYATLHTGFRDEIYQSLLDSARCYRALGEYSSAREAAWDAMLLDSRRAETYVLLGEMAYTAQNWSQAVIYFKAARACTPPDDVVLFLEPAAYSTIPADNLTICYDKLNRPDLALESALAAFDGPAPPPRIRANIAWCRRRARPLLLLALGPTPEPLPMDLDVEGAGGVETTYLELPPALADLGFDVVVAGRCAEHKRGRAWYLPYADLPAADLRPDLVIASRWFEPFDWYPDARRIVWLQDAWFADCLPRLQCSHANVVSSPWHRNYTLQRYGHAIDPARLHTIPLGIDLSRFLTHDTLTLDWEPSRRDTPPHGTPPHGAPPRDPLRVIYSSNPNRGLAELAQMWPLLREMIPGLRLTVTYGWEGLASWDASPEWRAQVGHTRNAVNTTLNPATGVIFAGRLGKRRLAQELQAASLLLYPNNFQETFCLTVLEAQAAGLPIISTNLGAIPTTMHPDAGLLIDGHPGTSTYQTDFIDAAVCLMAEPALRQRMGHAGRSHASQYDWRAIALRWQRLIWSLR